GGEHVPSREHPMLAADVVELHREGVARAGEVLVVENDGGGETLAAPATDHGHERLQHRGGDPRPDDGGGQVRASSDPFRPGGAAVEDETDELPAERLLDVVR